MSNEFIFYGAGDYAVKKLEEWLLKKLVPVCFADEDESKHYKKIKPFVPLQNEFEIFSLSEALAKYPDSDVYITLDPMTKAYQTVYDYIAKNGVPLERIGSVPEKSNGKQCIFYAAGRRAEINLKHWIHCGVIPVCFADSDERKQNSKISIPPVCVQEEFDILPIKEALDLYPKAFIYITASPNSYQNAYDNLIANGVPKNRIGASAQHCHKIGHYFLINGLSFSACCLSGFAEFLPLNGNIREDVEMYYKYCEQLRNDLNQGKLTTCTGCAELLPGNSNEELKITYLNLATGLPGGATCNSKCCYCNYGQLSSQKFRERTDNVLEILQFFAETNDVNALHYEAGEFTISPYKTEIVKLIKEKKWKGRILTNGFIYLEELKDLLSEKNIKLNVSLDSGKAETFAKIKGVDCFDKVVENLKKYATSGGEIQLKYIVLDGINCEKTDIDGFIGIAKEINATVVISRNNTTTLLPVADAAYTAILYLANRCISENIPYWFDYVTPDYIERLKKDGVYRSQS